MRHFCRHANAIAQLGLQVNGFAVVHRVCAPLNRQRNLANHVARLRAQPGHFGVGVSDAGNDACVAHSTEPGTGGAWF